jgi:hypothetical protein
MADNDAGVFRELIQRLQTARKDIVMLETTLERLRVSAEVFTQDELAAFEGAIANRCARLNAESLDLEARQQVYNQKVVRLREMLRIRDAVIGELDAEFGIMDRFPEETEVLVSTQAQLERDLHNAQADLRR